MSKKSGMLLEILLHFPCILIQDGLPISIEPHPAVLLPVTCRPDQICTLSLIHILSSIQQMFPMNLSEEEVQQIYTNFVHRYRTAYLRCVEQLEQLSEPVLDPGNQETSQVESLVLTTAVAATLYKLVTDKLLALQLPQEEPAH